jgi:hypothetical protein
MRSCWQDIAVVPLLVILPILETWVCQSHLCFYTLRLHMRWLCLIIISTVQIVLENHNRMAQTVDQVIETYHPWIFSWRSFSSIPVRMEWTSSWGSSTSTWLKEHCGSPAEYCRFQCLAPCGLRKFEGIAQTWSHISRWSSLRRLFQVRVPDSNEFVLADHLFDGSLAVL